MSEVRPSTTEIDLDDIISTYSDKAKAGFGVTRDERRDMFTLFTVADEYSLANCVAGDLRISLDCVGSAALREKLLAANILTLAIHKLASRLKHACL